MIMTKSLISLCGLAITCSLTVAHAQSSLNVKTGLWENTITTQMSGMPQMPQIPADALARMTPDQRARVQAAMGSGMGNGQPHTSKSCLTKEKLAQGFRPDDRQASNCKTTMLNVSANAMDMKEQCTPPSGSVEATLHVEAHGSDETSGTMHMVITQQGHTMTSDATFHGKWLGADCGDVK
jgi:hypothetical protein